MRQNLPERPSPFLLTVTLTMPGVYAKTIHRAIALRRGFVPITTVGAIAPGDIIAMEYYDDDRPSTGHVMIVERTPRLLPREGPTSLAPASSRWR